MDIEKYLQRIQFQGPVQADTPMLMALHEHHVFHVPFENLDIHYKRPFDLALSNIYTKVILNRRGGFCYELNYLFSELLNAIGFSTQLISARILTDTGEPGPPYDHMCVVVKTGKEYLVDVGFGDLFVRPLELRKRLQSDGRNNFLLEPYEKGQYILSMLSGNLVEKKYIFSLTEERVESFQAQCHEKQTSADSYFVKNTICTKPTGTGRITLFNDKLIEHRGDDRIVTMVKSDQDMRRVLKEEFDIDMVFQRSSFPDTIIDSN